jgi:hypothetical protein
MQALAALALENKEGKLVAKKESKTGLPRGTPSWHPKRASTRDQATLAEVEVLEEAAEETHEDAAAHLEPVEEEEALLEEEETHEDDAEVNLQAEKAEAETEVEEVDEDHADHADADGEVLVTTATGPGVHQEEEEEEEVQEEEVQEEEVQEEEEEEHAADGIERRRRKALLQEDVEEEVCFL